MGVHSFDRVQQNACWPFGMSNRMYTFGCRAKQRMNRNPLPEQGEAAFHRFEMHPNRDKVGCKTVRQVRRSDSIVSLPACATVGTWNYLWTLIPTATSVPANVAPAAPTAKLVHAAATRVLGWREARCITGRNLPSRGRRAPEQSSSRDVPSSASFVRTTKYLTREPGSRSARTGSLT